ncbi:MAG: 2'-5' RNA ligase family protein [Sphingobium sp.]
MRDHKPKPVRYRLFFALKPSALIARHTDHFAATLAHNTRRIALEHQHVTLALATDHDIYPYAVIKALMRTATAVRADGFDLPLDRLSIGERSAALIPSRSNPRLRALQHAVAAAMKRAGAMFRPEWRFSPHQTLFYCQRLPESRLVPGFCWRVEEFVLICSHVGRTRHDILGRWPLRGSGQYELF